MITALALVSLIGLLALCLRRTRPPAEPAATEYPESMTAELEPGDEEFLAWLADQLWPEDEYLDFDTAGADHDDEEESGGMFC